MSYRSELIQLAASAIAAIEDFDTGLPDMIKTDEIFDEIRLERVFQINKFGVTHRTSFLYNTIIGKKFGEVCEQSLIMEFG